MIVGRRWTGVKVGSPRCAAGLTLTPALHGDRHGKESQECGQQRLQTSGSDPTTW